MLDTQAKTHLLHPVFPFGDSSHKARPFAVTEASTNEPPTNSQEGMNVLYSVTWCLLSSACTEKTKQGQTQKDTLPKPLADP